MTAVGIAGDAIAPRRPRARTRLRRAAPRADPPRAAPPLAPPQALPTMAIIKNKPTAQTPAKTSTVAKVKAPKKTEAPKEPTMVWHPGTADHEAYCYDPKTGRFFVFTKTAIGHVGLMRFKLAPNAPREWLATVASMNKYP